MFVLLELINCHIMLLYVYSNVCFYSYQRYIYTMKTSAQRLLIDGIQSIFQMLLSRNIVSSGSVLQLIKLEKLQARCMDGHRYKGHTMDKSSRRSVSSQRESTIHYSTIVTSLGMSLDKHASRFCGIFNLLLSMCTRSLYRIFAFCMHKLNQLQIMTKKLLFHHSLMWIRNSSHIVKRMSNMVHTIYH